MGLDVALMCLDVPVGLVNTFIEDLCLFLFRSKEAPSHFRWYVRVIL